MVEPVTLRVWTGAVHVDGLDHLVKLVESNGELVPWGPKGRRVVGELGLGEGIVELKVRGALGHVTRGAG
eukprot:3110814-Alexandrium_andersonii.AAC.1